MSKFDRKKYVNIIYVLYYMYTTMNYNGSSRARERLRERIRNQTWVGYTRNRLCIVVFLFSLVGIIFSVSWKSFAQHLDQESICWDWIREIREWCDDGNNISWDWCSTMCLIENNQSCDQDVECKSGLCRKNFCYGMYIPEDENFYTCGGDIQWTFLLWNNTLKEVAVKISNKSTQYWFRTIPEHVGELWTFVLPVQTSDKTWTYYVKEWMYDITVRWESNSWTYIYHTQQHIISHSCSVNETEEEVLEQMKSLREKIISLSSGSPIIERIMKLKKKSRL